MPDIQQEQPTEQDVAEAKQRLADSNRLAFTGNNDVFIQVVAPKDVKRPGSKVIWAAADILGKLVGDENVEFLDARDHSISAFKMSGENWVDTVEKLTGNKPDLNALKEKTLGK